MTDDSTPVRGRITNFFTELSRTRTPVGLDVRGENAWAVAIKFMSLLRDSVKDPEELRKLQSAWYKRVRDNDFKKFRRALNRYRRAQRGEVNDQEDLPGTGEAG